MGFIGNLIYSTISSKPKVERLQKKIRDEEWKWIIGEIPRESKFLDVGCGAGYAMQRAAQDAGCTSWGIDPNPGAHGVGRYIKDMVSAGNIQQGFAEKLPFDDKTFDVVFSSHVLEHVNDEKKSLSEMARVLKDDGVIIVGMPTATMATINLISQLLFLTHIKIYEFIRKIGSKEAIPFFKKIFEIPSHSYPRANSISYDIKHYSVKNWQSIISSEMEVLKVLQPCLYPYPDYPQWFPFHHSKWASSSVFFICKKK